MLIPKPSKSPSRWIVCTYAKDQNNSIKSGRQSCNQEMAERRSNALPCITVVDNTLTKVVLVEKKMMMVLIIGLFSRVISKVSESVLRSEAHGDLA